MSDDEKARARPVRKRKPPTVGGNKRRKQGVGQGWNKWIETLPPSKQPAARARLDRSRAMAPRAKVKLQRGDEGLIIGAADDQHPNEFSLAFMEATGSASESFSNRTATTMAALYGGAESVREEHWNTGLAIMAAVQPENELEALLAVQMIAANEGMLKSMAHFRNSEMINQTQAFGNLANKFARTFTAQMEALAKMRRGGEQVVKHVHVYEGGQAIVADTINQGGRGATRNAEQCHAAETVAGGPALLGQDTPLNLVPGTGHAERAMQNARRDEPRCTEGES